MKRLEEIKKILQEHKKEINEKYKVKRIGIFGSYVRDEEREGSDIDILMKYDKFLVSFYREFLKLKRRSNENR